MKYRVRKLAPKIPTASMADIAFLLIIFFMLTTSFSPEKTSVQLPESAIQQEISDQAAIIAITNDGQINYSDGEAPSVPVASLEELKLQVRGMVEAAPFKEFAIKADRMVEYRRVDEVLDVLRTSGVKKISLLTRQRILLPGEKQQPQDEQKEVN